MIRSQLLGPIRESLDILARENNAGVSPQLAPIPDTPKKLKIGIIGFGKFGQFLAKTFIKHHDVFAVDRSDQVGEEGEVEEYWSVTYVGKPTPCSCGRRLLRMNWVWSTSRCMT